MLNGKAPERSVDYSEMIKNTFVHTMSNIITVRAFLEKYGYGKYWRSWDLKNIYDTYAVLKTKNFE